jgi:alkylation response protein AidB-like acyl-CoA dehydrogenase
VTFTAADDELVRRRVERLLADHDPASEDPVEFLGAQFDLGLAWVHFPEGNGGLGVTPGLQAIVSTALADARAPVASTRNPIGVGMAAPTVVTHGSDAQRRRYLRPLWTGEEVWCQLFSEPGAGSDVAGLATRAVRDGDEWVVNGQKVWTSLAHLARWGLLLARTDPDVPKHRGLSYFVLDMQAPGVEVRPLRQMTGDAEFNEVYFSDARIPDVERLGDVGTGWNVALTTLMNERVFIGGNAPPRGSGLIGEAVRLWNERGHADPARRDRLVELWIEAEALRLTTVRAAQLRRAGTPGPEGSTAKLAAAELNKKISAFCMDLLGADALLYGTYDVPRTDRSMIGSRDIRMTFLRSRANSIEGGTSEVMRNILGERVLGLPGDIRVDRDAAWSELPHG